MLDNNWPAIVQSSVYMCIIRSQLFFTKGAFSVLLKKMHICAKIRGKLYNSKFCWVKPQHSYSYIGKKTTCKAWQYLGQAAHLIMVVSWLPGCSRRHVGISFCIWPHFQIMHTLSKCTGNNRELFDKTYGDYVQVQKHQIQWKITFRRKKIGGKVLLFTSNWEITLFI